jgi:hypothetical protein
MADLVLGGEEYFVKPPSGGMVAVGKGKDAVLGNKGVTQEWQDDDGNRWIPVKVNNKSMMWRKA